MLEILWRDLPREGQTEAHIESKSHAQYCVQCNWHSLVIYASFMKSMKSNPLPFIACCCVFLLFANNACRVFCFLALARFRLLEGLIGEDVGDKEPEPPGVTTFDRMPPSLFAGFSDLSVPTEAVGIGFFLLHLMQTKTFFSSSPGASNVVGGMALPQSAWRLPHARQTFSLWNLGIGDCCSRYRATPSAERYADVDEASVLSISADF